MNRRLVPTALASCALLACAEGSAGDESDLLCRVAIDSQVVLQEDSTISGDMFGNRYAINSRGQILGGAWRDGQVLVWDSAGTLIRTVGSPGEGPGELAPGIVTVFVAPGDTLFVRDNHLHWVVFDPDFNFVRNVSMGRLANSSHSTTAFLADGSVASTVLRRPDTHYTMIRGDREGNSAREFGPSHDLPGLNSRPFVPDGNGGYWVGLPPGPRYGYVIHHWNSEGEVIGEIRREVPWFQAQPSYVDHNLPPRVEPPHGTIPSQGFPYPTVDQLHLDGDGRLWVISRIPFGPDISAEYATTLDESVFVLMERGLVRRIEAFDPATGEVLGSIQLPHGYFFGFVQGTTRSIAARVLQDEDGFRRVTMLQLKLAATEGGAPMTDLPSMACH